MIEEWQIAHNQRYINDTTSNCFRWLANATYFLGGIVRGYHGDEWLQVSLRNDISFGFYTSYGVTRMSLKSKTLRTGISVGGDNPFHFKFLGREEDHELMPSVILNTARALVDMAHTFFPGSSLESHLTDCYGCGRFMKRYPYIYGNARLEQNAPILRICRCVGDKWLCDDCQDRFSLPVPNAAETDNEKKVHPERAKMTVTLRFDVLARDRFACKTCGRSPLTEDGVKLHVDHIYPVSLGGKTEMDNLQALCDLCNLGKSNKVVEQLTLGI